jgi:AAA15 family ATPase/GTPase
MVIIKYYLLYLPYNSKNNKMIIEFKFKNFMSYKDETTINMTSVKSFKELKNSNVITKVNSNFNLLKSAAIFGSNGGGKSNFIEAILFMKDVFHNSYLESLKKEEERGRKDYYFKLNTITEKKPTTFEISFIVNNIIYRYGFEIFGFEIISEWLYKKNEVETYLFKRNRQNFEINKSSFTDGLKYKDSVNSNVLFISYLAQNNSKDIQPVQFFFKRLNVLSGLDDKTHNNVTKVLYNVDSNFKTWLSLALRFLEITKVGVTKDDNIVTYHNKFDENDFIVDSIPFNLEEDESQGTKKIVFLLGAIYDTLVGGKVLFIDELDSKLHPNLTKKLLDFFQKFNKNNAQFIFTSHDANLLNKDILRRDQIWFVDRNKFGASELYSLSDFDASVVRSTSDFRKKYLDNSFGAAETINITDDLIELMYGSK